MSAERIVNKILLHRYTTTDCAVCGKTPCAPVHIYEQSKGGPDLDDNLIPLCKTHYADLHNMGWLYFLEVYESALIYLRRKGWVVDREGFKNFQ